MNGQKIPVSVIIATKNEAARIEKCLAPLTGFEEVVVVDSESTDATVSLARDGGARVVPFAWNGGYPKKRQWILDTLPTRLEWIFFVDADEIVTKALTEEIAALFEKGPAAAGYFVKGRYVRDGKALRFGAMNNKLALFNREKFEFPVVSDLDIPGMGEMEGHYQPVLRPEYAGEPIKALSAPLLHEAFGKQESWARRHENYARWEAGMNARQAWPTDPVFWREWAKRALRACPLRPELWFLYGYFWKLGILDGKAGYALARSRWDYYKRIALWDKQLREAAFEAALSKNLDFES